MNDFFANLYELITGQDTDLSKLLYDEGTYVPVGIAMLLLSAIGMAVYYYVINHPRFARWCHWLIVVIAVCVINFVVAYAMADGVVWNEYETTDGYFTDVINFGITNALWSILFSFVFSMILKWGSTNAKHSPF